MGLQITQKILGRKITTLRVNGKITACKGYRAGAKQRNDVTREMAPCPCKAAISTQRMSCFNASMCTLSAERKYGCKKIYV